MNGDDLRAARGILASVAISGGLFAILAWVVWR